MMSESTIDHVFVTSGLGSLKSFNMLCKYKNQRNAEKTRLSPTRRDA